MSDRALTWNQITDYNFDDMEDDTEYGEYDARTDTYLPVGYDADCPFRIVIAKDSLRGKSVYPLYVSFQDHKNPPTVERAGDHWEEQTFVRQSWPVIGVGTVKMKTPPIPPDPGSDTYLRDTISFESRYRAWFIENFPSLANKSPKSRNKKR